MKKILIGGPMYGQKNIGDEVILESIIKSVRKIFGDVNIRVITNDVKNTKESLNVGTIPLSGPFRKLKALLWCDLFICGGATILSDCPYFALSLVKTAKLFKKDVYIYAVGMNEISNRKTRNYVVKYVNKADAVTVRDKDVKQRLERYGARVGHVIATADPAFLKKPKLTHFPKEKIKWLSKKKKDFLVGLGISGEMDVKKITPIGEYVKLCKNLLEKIGATVVFLPTNFRKGMDIDLAREIIQKAETENIFLLSEKIVESSELIAILEKFDIVLSSRLHLLIFSAIANVPFVGIARGEKMESFMRDFEQEAVSNVRNMNADKCLEEVKKILETKNVYKEKIGKCLEIMKTRALKNEEVLKKFT